MNERFIERVVTILINGKLDEWLSPEAKRVQLQGNVQHALDTEPEHKQEVDKLHSAGNISHEDALTYGHRPGGSAPVAPRKASDANANIEKQVNLRQKRAQRVMQGRGPSFIQRAFGAPEPPASPRINQGIPDAVGSPLNVHSAAQGSQLLGNNRQKFYNRLNLIARARGRQL